MLVSLVAGCGVSKNPDDPNATATTTPSPTPTPTPTPYKSLPPVPSPSRLTIREDANGWRYSVENGQMTIFGYNGSEKSVTIPAEITDEKGQVYNVTVLDGVALCKYTRSIIGDTRYSCDLEDVVIPDFIDQVPIGLFEQCDNLKSVSWKGFKIVNNIVFSSDMTILYTCLNKDITSYKIPSSVKVIAGGAFRNCSKLTSITIPGTVETVGNYAFYGCSALVSANIEEGVQALGTQLFTLCLKLESLMIPSSVTSIGYFVCSKSADLKIYIKKDSHVDKEFKLMADDKLFAAADSYLDYVVYID